MSHSGLRSSAWWTSNQNAFIERFNRTYRTERLDAHLFANLQQVQAITDKWLVDYNEYRPHEALGGVPPVRFMPRPTLLSISRRGDTYLRTLLIYGARAVVRVAEHKPSVNGWACALINRRHKNIAAVALANKNARIAWALLAHHRQYQAGHGALA